MLRRRQGDDPDKPRQGFVTRRVMGVVGMAAEKQSSGKDDTRHQGQNAEYNSRLAAPPSYEDSANAPSSSRRSFERSPSRGNQPPRRSFDDGGHRPTYDDDDSDDSYDQDDEDQELDDMAEHMGDPTSGGKIRKPPPTAGPGNPESVPTLVKSFTEQFPPPSDPSRVPKIRMPIVLPQRRPGNRMRGFVHAYSPVLEEIGISMEEFMSFHEYFDEAIRVSQAFNVINAASAVVGLVSLVVPSPTVNAISQVVQYVDIAAQVSYARYRSNTFLDKLNEEYFKHYGLFAMIVSYKENDPNLKSTRDLNTGEEIPQEKSDAFANVPEMGSSKNPLRGSSGKTKGDLNMPEPAPLIFPQIDDWAARGEKAPKGAKPTFLSDYMDRRAQASFQKEHPDSVLAASKVSWSNKMADPLYQQKFMNTRQMLVANMTGGDDWYSKRQRRRQERTATNNRRRNARRESRRDNSRRQNRPSLMSQAVAGVQGTEAKNRRDQQRGGALRGVRENFRDDAMYLLITSLPTEKEKQEINQALKDAGVPGGDPEKGGASSSSRSDQPPTYEMANMSMKVQR